MLGKGLKRHPFLEIFLSKKDRAKSPTPEDFPEGDAPK